MFNSLVKKEKKVKPASTEVMVNNPVAVAMEIENAGLHQHRNFDVRFNFISNRAHEQIRKISR